MVIIRNLNTEIWWCNANMQNCLNSSNWLRYRAIYSLIVCKKNKCSFTIKTVRKTLKIYYFRIHEFILKFKSFKKFQIQITIRSNRWKQNTVCKLFLKICNLFVLSHSIAYTMLYLLQMLYFVCSNSRFIQKPILIFTFNDHSSYKAIFKYLKYSLFLCVSH